jgi:hypothetical protein
MANEGYNEYRVFRDTAAGAGHTDREGWVKNCVREKIKTYHTDPVMRNFYDKWDFHHGASK